MKDVRKFTRSAGVSASGTQDQAPGRRARPATLGMTPSAVRFIRLVGLVFAGNLLGLLVYSQSGFIASGISHDLNNILSPVLMAAPLLRIRATHPADLRMLDTVEKSAERGSALVRQILSFARGAGCERVLL